MSVISSSGSNWQNPGDPNIKSPNPSGSQGIAGIFAVHFNNVPLVNGTPILASIPIPNDGNEHLALCLCVVTVTTTEVGGGITAGLVAGGVAGNPTLNSGSNTPGVSQGTAFQPVDPGSTATIKQLTALTSGAATASGTIIVI